MAQYRVLDLSFIDNALRVPGAIIEVEGPVGANLEGPLDADGNVAKAKKSKAEPVSPAEPAPAANPLA